MPDFGVHDARQPLLPNLFFRSSPASLRPRASLVLAFCMALGAAGLLTGCAGPVPVHDADAAAAVAATHGGPQGGHFVRRSLPGADGATALQVLTRGERTAPLRYRVIVIPGSGCAGMGPIAERYFAGLLHAQVLVLHKSGVDPQARTAAGDCTRDFVQQDRLSAWLAQAKAALQADAQQRAREGAPALPQLLVGISEGAELVPALAREVPQLAGLVLLSASGLDPQEAGTLQARRLGAQADWDALGRAVASRRPDTDVVQGRSLGYWRDLWRWPLTQPLVRSPWPLLQVWGAEDALVPPAAYERFAERARGRAGPYCVHRMEGADHGLQRRAGSGDGVQRVWSWLEQWARAPAAGLCAPVPSP